MPLDGEPKQSCLTRARPKARDDSIDVLRGLTCFGMILVNTASAPPRFLRHATSLNDPITFADTIFPCFLFTSGLAEKVAGPSTFRKSLRRAILLNLLGVAFNNVLPRILGRSQRGDLFEWRTYRLPSVLGRLGIASLISASGLSPPLLIALWHLLASSRPLDPPGVSTQAVIDRAAFGTEHLYDRVTGFDPEGLLGSFLTAPVSLILGRQAYEIFNQGLRPSYSMIITLFSLFRPKTPATKPHWTPTFTGITTLTSLLYWKTASFLTRFKASKALAILGRCSLEVYLLSSFFHIALTETGIWGSLDKVLSQRFGFSNEVVSTTISSILAVGMVPVANLLSKYGWFIRL
ncbi:hypothetical protein CROQUDRAFT_36966 [Cronartium quercuum f. sp. fusiforme G11]|uniref:Uncharacterized protein n=1 Tax=Cronartium quercuum f. sp. fusiforme G11 TaxID=708437 RepID=A0A9P6THZ0_9BASI|nr:hypothetical protein CROQUDRAFT_36966 [Cronartium quercuum f. sp. fusiforme G11]